MSAREVSIFPHAADSSASMRSISVCSLTSSIRSSLFASTTDIGSMKSVAPDAEVSWTSPFTSFRDDIASVSHRDNVFLKILV